MKLVKNTFKYAFSGIVLCLVLLYGFYRYTFNGNLSDEVSDWVAFVSIFNGVGIVLLTALNVWIFYKLTILIAENEEKYRRYDKQRDALNHFIHSIYAVLTPGGSGENVCAVIAVLAVLKTAITAETAC